MRIGAFEDDDAMADLEDPDTSKLRDASVADARRRWSCWRSPRSGSGTSTVCT